MLYLNEEDGSWYSLDDDTPLDASGNPIIPSGTSPISVGSTSWFKGITDLLKGTGSFGPGGQLLGITGLAALLNKLGGGGGGGFSGYQGGIPQYTATRVQTPIAQQRPTTTVGNVTTPYRPGQGGITYFEPLSYTPAPVTTPPPGNAAGGYMPGGIAMLAGGGQGGRYLRGPGDGVSDSIAAKFDGSGRPARLADGEFVIDARTVSEIGNGSSEAGARKLYAMMERVHNARKRAKRGKPSGADKFLPK
jgi:hypothetical protein